jgi:zinc and cadmium transporter
MIIFSWSILAVLLVSVLSFVGGIGLIFKDRVLKSILPSLVALSAGALIGGAFLHLLPESIESSSGELLPFVFVLVGFGIFFILEKVLRWHHCHDDGCSHKHHLGVMNLVGDGVHNFIDGLIIFAAFYADFHLGLVVTLSVIIHEIPQELGDLGVLIYSGFSKVKALLFNFASALTSILGVVVAYYLINFNYSISGILLPLAAGGFIYIGASDLVPELHQEKNTAKSVVSFAIFVLALVFMYLIKVIAE